MILAETFFLPGIGVSAVAAARDTGLQPDAVARVVALFEAIVAYDARGVLLTVFALPRDIARFQRLGANAHILKFVHKRLNHPLVVGRTVDQCRD